MLADCLHVNDYFRRQGVATLTVRELFDFVVDPGITEDNLDAALDNLMEMAGRWVWGGQAGVGRAGPCMLGSLRHRMQGSCRSRCFPAHVPLCCQLLSEDTA